MFPRYFDYSVEEPAPPDETKDEKLLREIRDTYQEFANYWREIRDERSIDMRYICGQPWDAKDLKARQELGRPAISWDELGQYVNACVNSARQNPRGVKVEPAGNGSNSQTAEFRQDQIRAIEYKSKASAAYLRAYQDMVEGSYGFVRLTRSYVSEDPDAPDDQEIRIEAVMNPDSVLYDPTCKTPDWSDAKRVFVLEPMTREQFKREWPEAKVQDFTSYHMDTAKDFITEKMVLVCEYWKVETKKVWNTRRTRKIEQRTVTQHMTNGIEILETNEEPGCHIPVVPFVGLERWTDDGGIAKRKLFSLVRLARDPQMSLAYLCSQQMEEAGLSPKVPYIGYVGQFETDRNQWDNAGRQPYPYLQVDPIPDGANGQILPLPQKTAFTPNFQGYEIAKDSCRRAIQAAMGISPLPTAAQRQSEKSGVALERIQSQEALGSYHFVDGFDRAIEYAGRIISQWIPEIYDAERDIALRKPDDTHQIVRINTPLPYQDPETGAQRHHVMQNQGDHDISVSVGPSYSSQREEAASFLDTLIANLPNLPVAPPQAAKLLSLAVQMRQLGPKGDEMAEIISPTSPDQAQQAGQQIGALQGQLQQSQQLIQLLGQELQRLQQEKQGKVVDNEYKMAVEKMKEEHDLAMAEITSKSQILSERAAFINDLWKQWHQQGFDAQQAGADRAHEMMMQQGDQAHDLGMMAAQPPQPAAGTATTQ